MTDITSQVLPEHTFRPDPHFSQFTKESAAVFFQLKTLKLSLVTELRQQKKSALPLPSQQDSKHLTALAKLSKETDALKQLLPSPKAKQAYGHANSVLTCLYNQMKDISTTLKEMQQSKQRQQAVFDEFQHTRKSRVAEAVPVKTIVRDGPEFKAESAQLLQELQQDNRELLEIQKSLFEINSIMGFFAQKVAEQEEVTQHILQDATDALGSMVSAKAHLASANELSKGMEYWWVAYFVTLTSILWFYEWWNTQYVYI